MFRKAARFGVSETFMWVRSKWLAGGGPESVGSKTIDHSTNDPVYPDDELTACTLKLRL